MKPHGIHLAGWAWKLIASVLPMLCNITTAHAIDVFFTGRLVAAPPCIINGNNAILVDFGEDLLIGRIDGVNYELPINYTMDCSAAASTQQRLQMSGTAAGFNPLILATSKPGLGIKIRVNNNPVWPLGSWVNFTDPALPSFKAVPVKDPAATLTGGPFTATATLIVAYQ